MTTDKTAIENAMGRPLISIEKVPENGCLSRYPAVWYIFGTFLDFLCFTLGDFKKNLIFAP